MKNFFTIFLISLFFSTGNVLSNGVVSDAKISEISERLEQYSAEALIERRDFLISFQEGDEEEDKNGVPAGTGAAQDFNVMFVPRQEDKDWGKLRESSAKDATVGSSQAIAEEYRKNVEAYFKVLAERARK